MTGCGKVFWRPDLGGALQRAARENRIVIVAYWLALNAECQRMEDEVLSDKEVQRSLRGTIPVRIDALLNPGFGRKNRLTRVPAFVAIAPDGRILRVAEGYLNEGRFRGFIEAAKLSL